LSGYIFATKSRIDKNSNTFSTGLHNMVNFVGPLTAEIYSGVWGTPANFNGFRFLAALLHGTLVVGVGVSQTAALNRGRHLQYIRQGGHHVGHWPTF